MKNFRKIIILSCIILFGGCEGVSYPGIVFRFDSIGDDPPAQPIHRFKYKEKYPQEIDIVYRRPGNSFKTFLELSIFVQKQYKKLHIKELRYSWKNGNGVLIEDTKYKLPEYVNKHGSKKNHYWGKEGYYWTYQLIPIDVLKDKRYIDLQKIFKDRNPGERFKVNIEIDYQFDDDEVKTQLFQYNVTVIKNTYKSPFM